MNKTPTKAKRLISNMAANVQQFGDRQDYIFHKVSEVNISSIEQRLDCIITFIETLVVGQVQQIKIFEICNVLGHSTNICPILRDDLNEHANVVGGFLGPPQRRFDHYSNTYNS